MNEKDLISGCIREDRKCQEALWDKYNDKMFKICKENCESEREAKDALVEGFIKIYDNIKHFKGGSLEKWMEVIMQKECNNMKPKWNPFNWQGRRKDQVEFSENVVAFSISIIIIIVLSILANALV
jgi:DNA-directed RNA polymerase specialized sigma24 family protein